MNCLFFYFPIFFLYHTRQKSFKKFLSWGMVHLIPVCVLAMMQSSFSITSMFISLLGVAMIYNFYEIGYIQNDAETIKNESDPTLRLNTIELSYYEIHKTSIYGVRLILGGILSYVLMRILPHPQFFLICIFSLLLIYQIYNRIRNLCNLFLHIFLISIRFCSVQLLFFPDINWAILIGSFFIYPFANILERASFPKYKIGFMRYLIGGKSKIVSFRVKYYVIVLSIAIILAFIMPVFDVRLCVLLVYYLVIRFLFLFFVPKDGSTFIYFK